MKNWFNKIVSGTLATLAAFSLTLTPAIASAQGAPYYMGNDQCCPPANDCCAPANDCCDPCAPPCNPCWNSCNTWLLVGSLLLGAAAGAAAGAATSSSKHGHRGDPGATGATGPQGIPGIPGPTGSTGATGATGIFTTPVSATSNVPFAVEPGATSLTFDFSHLTFVGTLAGATGIPFVSEPNGVVVPGAPFAIPTVGTATGPAIFIVSGPLPYGTYTPGVLVEGPAGTTVTIGGGFIEVGESRDVPTETTTIDVVGTGAQPLTAGGFEVTGNFVYGSEPVP